MGFHAHETLTEFDCILYYSGELSSYKFHALTDCDASARFADRIKDLYFKAFIFCDDEILDSLELFGNSNDLPSDVSSLLKHFVCILCRSKIHTKVA
jgi:hypothetical protein